MDRKSRTKPLISRIVSPCKSVVASAILLGLLFVLGLIGAAPIEPPPRPDFDYNFTIKDLEGNHFPVEKFKGKVIFLNMWATWCGPCRMEMPGIQSLFEKADKEKVVFIMLSIDRDEDMPRVAKYVRDKSFTFKPYLPTGFLPDQLNVPSIPTTFIISPEGKVVRKEVGAQPYDTPEFEALLEKLSK